MLLVQHVRVLATRLTRVPWRRGRVRQMPTVPVPVLAYSASTGMPAAARCPCAVCGESCAFVSAVRYRTIVAEDGDMSAVVAHSPTLPKLLPESLARSMHECLRSVGVSTPFDVHAPLSGLCLCDAGIDLNECTMTLCATCNSSLVKHRLPRFALANGFDVGLFTRMFS